MVKLLKRFAIAIVLNGIALYALLMFMPEIGYRGGWTFFVVGGILMAILNGIIKPLIKIFALPVIVLTGGLFLIVINAGLLWFLSYFFEIAQFRDLALIFPNLGSYAIGALVFGVINWIEHLIIKNDK
jgi:putative membrane protein